MLIILIELFPQISQEIRACLFLFLKRFSLCKQSMSIYAFTSSLPLFYITFLWGEDFSGSFPCEAIYCKNFLQPGCHPCKIPVLQKKSLHSS